MPPTESAAMVDDPREGFPLSYECCGRDAPGKWHERLIVCPAFLVLLAALGVIATVVVVIVNA